MFRYCVDLWLFSPAFEFQNRLKFGSTSSKWKIYKFFSKMVSNSW